MGSRGLEPRPKPLRVYRGGFFSADLWPSQRFRGATYCRSLGLLNEPGVLGISFCRERCGIVEAEPFHITNPHVESAPLEEPNPARGGGAYAPAERRRTTPTRLGLQHRAQFNFQRHFLRGLRRFVILLTADLASFYVMRALVRAVRDHA